MTWTGRYASRQELADKADYEGGIVNMLFGYGLEPDDVPEDDAELRGAIVAALECKSVLDKLEALLPEPGEDDDGLD